MIFEDSNEQRKDTKKDRRKSNRHKESRKNEAKFIIQCGGWAIEKIGQVGNIYSGLSALYAFFVFCSGYGLIKFFNSLQSICSICIVFPYFLVRAFFNL